jgi:hypothetical protein
MIATTDIAGSETEIGTITMIIGESRKGECGTTVTTTAEITRITTTITIPTNFSKEVC